MIGSFAMPAGAVVPVVQPLAPGPNPGAPVSFSLDVNGLLDGDDFARADSDSPGGNWTERRGDVDIASGRLLLQGGTSVTATNSAAAASTKGFVQAVVQWSSAAVPTGIGLMDWNAGTPRAYQCQADDFAGVLKIVRQGGGGFADVVTQGGLTFSIATDYTIQFFSADSVQQGWMETDGSPATVSAANANHDGITKVAHAERGGTTATGTHDDWLWMADKVVIVSGLASGSGQKAKIVNIGDSIVAEAVESSGTATIDCSRFGSATEIVPFAGWPTLRITDSGDSTIDEATAAELGVAVYPGHQVSVTGLA